MIVYAGTPVYCEDDATLERARLSVLELDGWATFRSDRPALDEGAMRRQGFELAREHGADWYLQLDADERLVGAADLRERLAATAGPFYPLPYVQEDGQVTLAPFKLARPDQVELVAHSDYFRVAGRVYCCSGYRWASPSTPAELGLPHLLHEPSRRRQRHRRLSDVELDLEPRPADAVQWPVIDYHLLHGGTMTATELNEAGEVVDERKFYCPGCGQRYDAAGDCVGSAEGPHEPIAVEKVSAAGKDKDGDK